MKTALLTVLVVIVFAGLFILSLCPWRPLSQWRVTAGKPTPAPPREGETPSFCRRRENDPEALSRAPETPPPLAGLPPLLFALASVETGGDATAIGPGGERSAWQFTPETWARHSTLPFLFASSDPVQARHVAELHLAYLTAELYRRHLPATEELLAAAWRYGPASARICAGTDYAERVARLTRAVTPPVVSSHP